LSLTPSYQQNKSIELRNPDRNNGFLKKCIASKLKKVKSELKKLCAEIDQSVVIQSGDIYPRSKKLVVFDVESSLVQQTSLKKFIQTIHAKMHMEKEGSKPQRTPDDQLEVLVDNAKRLRGLSANDLEKYVDILQLNPGTFELIKIMI
jgi:hypothetical protein